MTYQALIEALETKLSERIAVRRQEMQRLNAELAFRMNAPGVAQLSELETRARIVVIDQQIAKLADALSALAESAGTQ